MMDFTLYGWIAGITSIVIITICYFCSVIFLARYTKSRRPETFLQSIAFFALGSNWLGAGISFPLILLGKDPLGKNTMIQAWGWAPAVVTTVWIYLVFSLIRPNLKNLIAAIYVALDVIYAFLLYTKTSIYGTYQLIGNFPDSGVQGIVLAFLIFYIISALVLIGPMYLWISVKSTRPVIQLRGRTIGVGVILFSVFAIFESFIGPSTLLLISSRIMIMCSIILIWTGFTLPSWFRRRFLAEETSET